MKKGFTLTELLLALTIVGVLAVLTVPILMNNIHNKMFATQVKNMAATIEQLAQDELVPKRTRDLRDTDFSSPALLLTDKHFAIAKTCATESDAKLSCWKTTATGKDKITYKNLNNAALTSNMNINRTLVLKNGVIITCNSSNTSWKSDIAAGCTIDVNGNEKPNIAGRDLFRFWLDVHGHIENYYNQAGFKTLSQKQNNCKTSLQYCFSALAENGWKIDY